VAWEELPFEVSKVVDLGAGRLGPKRPQGTEISTGGTSTAHAPLRQGQLDGAVALTAAISVLLKEL
jgi:hypothetical protein